MYLVYNPKAGSARANLQDLVAATFPADTYDIEMQSAEDASDLRKSVAKAVEAGFDTFAIAGGDGSIALLADRVRDRGVIGIVPFGTGNSLAQVLGVPLATDQALRIIARPGATRTIDGMEINGQLYLMNVSAGFTAGVIQGVNYRQKGTFGPLAYFLSAVRWLVRGPRRRSHSFHVTIDGSGVQMDAAEIMAINTAPWGMARYRIPGNRLDDGQLEVYAMRRGRLIDIVDTLLDIVLRERKVALKALGRGRRITIACDEEVPVQADGDIVGATPVTITAVPKAATFLVPK